MKSFFAVNIIALILLPLVGCKKSTPPVEPTPEAPKAAVEEPKAPQTPAEPVKAEVEAAKTEVVEAAKTAVEAAADATLVPIPLELPKPMFVGTPENLSGVDNLEKPAGKSRAPFLAPAGVTNLALNKPVTGSEEEPVMGTLNMITDGDKEASEGSVVELGPFEQWVQIDLEESREIYAVVFWHYHKTPRVYFDVVVQVSDDPDFTMDVTTLFNNDLDNSLGLGVGKDVHYVETAEGRLVDAKGVKGRYVRLYSQSNNQNDNSHYIEVEVFGK